MVQTKLKTLKTPKTNLRKLFHQSRLKCPNAMAKLLLSSFADVEWSISILNINNKQYPMAGPKVQPSLSDCLLKIFPRQQPALRLPVALSKMFHGGFRVSGLVSTPHLANEMLAIRGTNHWVHFSGLIQASLTRFYGLEKSQGQVTTVGSWNHPMEWKCTDQHLHGVRSDHPPAKPCGFSQRTQPPWLVRRENPASHVS